MAYIQRYKAIVYDREEQECQIIIYEDGFIGQWETIRVQSCSLAVKRDNHILTTSMDLVIINNTGSFNNYDDLMLGTEKKYFGRLYVAGTMEFEGFLICDVSEQELLDWATIRLTFTDYLKRLKDIDTPDLVLGGRSYLVEYIKDALRSTGLIYDIRVNANIFPTEVTYAYPGYTNLYELVQTYDDIFFEDLEKVVSVYDMLQDILTFNRAYLYVYRGIWYIEHYNVINDPSSTWPGNWTQFLEGESSAYMASDYDPTGIDPGPAEPLGTQPSPINPYKSINKQDGDFKYADRSQSLQYVSGLKELEINMEKDEFDTLVYNNFIEDPIGTHYRGTAASVKEWRMAELIDSNTITVDQNYRGISKYIKWTNPSSQGNPDRQGMMRGFRFSYNSEGDYNNPTMMKVNYKWSSSDFGTIANSGDRVQLIGRFVLLDINHLSSYHNRYLTLNDAGELGWDAEAGDPTDFDNATNEVIVDILSEAASLKTVEFSMSFDLTDLSGDPLALTDQIWAIVILPTQYRYANDTDDIEDNTKRVVSDQIIGDVTVNASANISNNINIYSVTDDFLKKETVNLKLFDAINLNYKNGLIYDDSRTSEWGTGENDSPNATTFTDADSIVNHLATSYYSYGSETRLKLTARLTLNEIVKPLTIISDDNIYKDSTGGILEFVLFGYTYNVLTNIIAIEADEYGDETINIIES